MTRPKNKKYRPKPIRIPVTGLHSEMALHLHAALMTLRYQPSVDAFDMLAGILNMIQVTIENDERFIHEAKLINGGAATLNQIARKIESGQSLQEFELGSIQVAVNTVDLILARLDVTRMHLAQLTVRKLQRAQQSEQITSLHS
jgi:hypothetical protein